MAGERETGRGSGRRDEGRWWDGVLRRINPPTHVLFTWSFAVIFISEELASPSVAFNDPHECPRRDGRDVWQLIASCLGATHRFVLIKTFLRALEDVQSADM